VRLTAPPGSCLQSECLVRTSNNFKTRYRRSVSGFRYLLALENGEQVGRPAG